MFPLNKNTTDGTDKFVTTYYVRDPQGNVLAVYEHKHGNSDNGTFTLAEQHLYGAGRLGMRKRDLALNVVNASESTPTVTHYELTNHLGNVLAVISDEASATAEPAVVSLSDYYPFGMTQPGRSYSHPGDDYRFGYTGHEKEKDLAKETYITEFRSLNTQTCRWLSVDPLWMKYPAVGSYVYCMNNPMSLVDIEGADIKIAGKNNSYVVFKTDLININVSAASLGIDWGGQYDLDGEDVLGAALDIVGIFDPTGIADGAKLKTAKDKMEWVANTVKNKINNSTGKINDLK